jgi:LysM repeat protein
MATRTRFAAAAIGATAVAAGPAAVMASSYVVRPGDTLTDIALRHGTSVRQLAQANHIQNPNYIKVGQLLSIPDPSRNVPQYAHAGENTDTYTVHRGDTLFGIARHYGVDPTALARANGINVNAILPVGVTLHVPGKVVRADALLTHIAQQEGVDVKLVKAVAWMESGWQQEVVSPTGAIGIMQVEPYTGEWVSRYLAHRKLDLHVAQDNVLAGVLLLKHLLAIHHGDVDAALAAYYQGDASIAEHGLFIDTKQYIKVVKDIYAKE